MLEPFTNFQNVWVEITRDDHGHGGHGWEYGTCLWSPSRDNGNADRYAVMREPLPGDLVLHFYRKKWSDGISDTRLCGKSIVNSRYSERIDEPPSPGQWANMAPYYRIDLKSYLPFPNPLPYEDFVKWYGADVRNELVSGRAKYHPFNTYAATIRTVQGVYLGKVTQQLYDTLGYAVGLEDAAITSDGSATLSGSSSVIDIHKDYAEGSRSKRESYFFTRNPSLAKDAKKHYGYECQVCKFNFSQKYGELGKNFIECHHLNPLSERTQGEWTQEVNTSIENVRVLCANCHRMIHKKKPALSIDELIAILTASSNAG